MNVAPTSPIPSPAQTQTSPANPPLGTWISRSDLAGARADFFDSRGISLYMGSDFPKFADTVIRTFDWNGDGSIEQGESTRTQQYAYASNRNGSRNPPQFVYSNSTIRQEIVSVQPLIDAAAGADKALTRDELTTFLTKLDANGNGFLDSSNHPGPVDEYANFQRLGSPVVIDARQMTVEGKLADVHAGVWDHWAVPTGNLPVPPVNDKPVLD